LAVKLAHNSSNTHVGPNNIARIETIEIGVRAAFDKCGGRMTVRDEVSAQKVQQADLLAAM
jgi:hypothetical protein